MRNIWLCWNFKHNRWKVLRKMWETSENNKLYFNKVCKVIKGEHPVLAKELIRRNVVKGCLMRYDELATLQNSCHWFFPFSLLILYSRVLVYLLMLQDRLLGNSVSPVEMPWGPKKPLFYCGMMCLRHYRIHVVIPPLLY